MKKIIYSLILLSFLISGLNSQPSRVEIKNFFSPQLGINKSYYIYLPAGYDSTTQRYPVVYFFRANEAEWFNASYRSNGKMLKHVTDSLITNNIIGKIIIVAPNTIGVLPTPIYAPGVNMLRPDLTTDPGIGTGKFEDYLLKDVIKNVDSVYRTIADFNHRAADGFSLGGYTSTMLALRNSGVFSSVGSYDGTLMWYNLHDIYAPGSGYNDETWMTDNAAYFSPIFNLPRNVPYMLLHDASNILYDASGSKLDSIKNIRFHITTGEEYALTNIDRNTQFVNFMKQKNICNSFREYILKPESVHNWDYADYHASVTLVRHWQKFNGSRISAPLNIDFGNVELGSSDTVRFLIFNYSTQPLSINSINLSSSSFTLVNNPAPYILQGRYDTLPVKVVFKPLSTSLTNASITIQSSDTASPSTAVNLSGKGFQINPAMPDILYALTGIVDTVSLITLNTTTGASTHIGKSGLSKAGGLAIRPSTGKLFTTFPSVSITNLVKVNSANGSSFKYSKIWISNMNSIAFDLNDDLYSAIDTNGILFRINPKSGDTVRVGLTGISNLTGLAVNPLNYQLWGISNNGNVYKINKTNATSTLVGSTGFTNSKSIAFNLSGKLFGVNGTASQISNLYAIDTAIGAGTLIGSTGKRGITGITFLAYPVTEVKTSEVIPEKYELSQNYPNPFNSITNIKFQIPYCNSCEGRNPIVIIKVFDLLGKEVRTLVNERKNSGTYRVSFDAGGLSSGVYFYKMLSGDFSDVKRMILIK